MIYTAFFNDCASRAEKLCWLLSWLVTRRWSRSAVRSEHEREQRRHAKLACLL